MPAALFNIGVPCMSGGSGGAITTLPKLYSDLSGTDMTLMAGQFLCFASIANVLAVVMAAVGGAVTSKIKGLNGNGDILCAKGAKMQTEVEKRPAASSDYVALGSGIFMSFAVCQESGDGKGFAASARAGQCRKYPEADKGAVGGRLQKCRIFHTGAS